MYLTKESEKAATLLRTTCDEYKYADSCHKYADLLRVAKFDFKVDKEIESFKYYRKGCEFGQAKSCFYTFFSLFDGKVKRQVLNEGNLESLALKMLERGCDLGSSESCYVAGGVHLIGIPGVLDKNVSTTSNRVNWAINSPAILSAALCQLKIPPAAIPNHILYKFDSCSWQSPRSEKKTVSKKHVFFHH